MKPTNHFTVRTELIPTKEKGRYSANCATPDEPITERNSTASDPLQGWFDLAKPARNRQQKRSWKRGKQQGRIDPFLLAELALMAVIVLLIAGGLANA